MNEQQTKRVNSCCSFIILVFVLAMLQHAQGYSIMTTTNDCRTKCLSQGSKATFCPSSDLKSGLCCSTATEPNCPRDFGKCSGDFSSNDPMQLFMCPFELYCGTTSYLFNATMNPQ